MKSQILSKALILSVLSLAAADETKSDFYEEAPTAINFPNCFRDLANADKNGDGRLKKDEYLGFIQAYAADQKCIENPVLTFEQKLAFNKIACECAIIPGADPNCCVGLNAEILTAGALDQDRTGAQQGYLTSACRITDETLGPPQCPPKDKERSPTDPLFSGTVFEVPPSPRSSGGSDGLSDGAMWGIIAAAAALLLLLCCCCLCVWRRKKAREEEEEEEEVIAGKGAPGDIETATPEQSAAVPREEDTPVIIATPLTMPPTGEDSDEEDEEARKRHGGGNLGEEEDEEGRKRYGAPRLPPPEKEDPELKLRPIDPEDEEDPDWDQPGRPLEMVKDKDDMSAGEVEHYEPDGGVYIPEREGKAPVEYDPQWERQTPEEPDEKDSRKHRIQSGLGEGEVWNKLNEDDSDEEKGGGATGGAFDWVVQSALGILDQNETGAHSVKQPEKGDEAES